MGRPLPSAATPKESPTSTDVLHTSCYLSLKNKEFNAAKQRGHIN